MQFSLNIDIDADLVRSAPAYPEDLIVRFVDDPSSPFNNAATDVDIRVEMKSSKIMERNREPLKRVIQAWKGTFGFLPSFQTPKFPMVPLELPFWQIQLILLLHQHSVHLQQKDEIFNFLNRNYMF